MKKSFLLSIAAAAILSGTAYGFLSSNNQVQEFSDLELANIEALTEDESGDFTCRWEPGEDRFGCACHFCIKTGHGNICKCGDVEYD